MGNFYSLRWSLLLSHLNFNCENRSIFWACNLYKLYNRLLPNLTLTEEKGELIRDHSNNTPHSTAFFTRDILAHNILI